MTMSTAVREAPDKPSPLLLAIRDWQRQLIQRELAERRRAERRD